METLPLALGITGLIYLTRLLFLLFFRMPIAPHVFIAPRGLITILLFLSVPLENGIPLVNRSLVIQTVLLSVVFIMLGLLFTQQRSND